MPRVETAVARSKSYIRHRSLSTETSLNGSRYKGHKPSRYSHLLGVQVERQSYLRPRVCHVQRHLRYVDSCRANKGLLNFGQILFTSCAAARELELCSMVRGMMAETVGGSSADELSR